MKNMKQQRRKINTFEYKHLDVKITVTEKHQKAASQWDPTGFPPQNCGLLSLLFMSPELDDRALLLKKT